MEKERSHSIDTLKFICAVLIIFNHVLTPYWTLSLPFTRIAMPCFFMISGYFLYTQSLNMQHRLLRITRRILKISFWSTLLYISLRIITDGFSNILTWENIRHLILFNRTDFFGLHLWYLFAYLYTLIVMMFVNRYNLWKACFCAIPILLVGELILDKYSLLIFGRLFKGYYTRNFLFMGIPFFAIGCLIKKYWNKLHTIRRKSAITTVILLTILLCVEILMLKINGLDISGDLYITTIPLTAAILLTTLVTRQAKPNLWSKLGAEYSLYIYVFHIAVRDILADINLNSMPEIWTDKIYAYISPFVILLCTIVLTYALKKVRIIS